MELLETREQITGPGRLLSGVLAAFEAAGVPYCILHGYQEYPERIDADVDCLVAAEWLPGRLAALLEEQRAAIGGEVTQWLSDGAHYLVVTGTAADGTPCHLALHVSGRYELGGRVFYTEQELLESRSHYRTFWVPAPEVEFGCVLVNRVYKGQLTLRHEERLTELFGRAPKDCAAQIRRWFGPGSTTMIATAARAGTWQEVTAHLPALRRELLGQSHLRDPLGRLMRWTARWGRRLRRWVHPPCGMHVVFLGPDGVGKSTIISGVEERWEGAFLQTVYRTFAPGLLPGRLAVEKPNGPHSLPPRSLPASLAKAAWWLACYTLGYYLTLRPALARASLVVNHRYLLDALVDAKRYRYSGPCWLLSLIWRVAPKPDLIFVLDAPAEVIHTRKKEVALEETARQRLGYRALVGTLANGHCVDASQPIEAVLAEVDARMQAFLAARVKRRFGHGRKA